MCCVASQPFRIPQEGQLYGWLPLSNAYGISSRCNKIHNIIPNGIPSVVSQSPNLTAECAPERGNEPLAQGTALGNLKQHKMIRPDRAKAPHTIQHPRRRLGLYDCWSFRPPLYGRVFIDWLLWRKWLPHGISSLWKNNMKKTDKNLSGKSDEREVKICKNDFSPFIFHSSFHYFSFNFFPSLRFRSVKGKLSPLQRLCFTAWNMVFRATKPYLSQIYFLQTARW